MHKSIAGLLATLSAFAWMGAQFLGYSELAIQFSVVFFCWIIMYRLENL